MHLSVAKPDEAEKKAPRQSPSTIAWQALDPNQAQDSLDTSVEHGLTADEAARRLEKHGPNELMEAPRPGIWRMLLEQFNNFIVIILIVAAVVSALLGDYVEAGAIMAIVLLNALLGVVQERRAEEAMAALRKLAAPEADIVRDGHRVTVPARELVPGDLVILEAGNYVPADVRLVDDQDRPVAIGEIGEIVMKGPMVFKGYWNLPEDNAQTFRGGWHHTGDLGRFDEDGFLWYEGRKAEKELIKPGGENVYPAEVEKIIREHPAVADTVVFGVPDPKYGEELMAWVIPKGSEKVSAEELRDFCRDKIAHYKIPRYFKFVDEFPITVTGKVRKFVMRDQSIKELGPENMLKPKTL